MTQLFNMSSAANSEANNKVSFIVCYYFDDCPTQHELFLATYTHQTDATHVKTNEHTAY